MRWLRVVVLSLVGLGGVLYERDGDPVLPLALGLSAMLLVLCLGSPPTRERELPRARVLR